MNDHDESIPARSEGEDRGEDDDRGGRADGGGRGRARAGGVRRLSLAVTFLTAVPLPSGGVVAEPGDLWGSMGWYPLVGLGLGTAGWVAYALLLYELPSLVAASLVVVGLGLATRALHLDGLMDTADGFWSGAPRERALEIMKDSHVGAMGVFAAVAVVVVKVSALASLARPGAALALLCGLSVARALPAVDVRFFPYARAEGTGASFVLGARARESLAPVVAAAALGAAAAIVAGTLGRGGVTGALLGLGLAFAAVALTLLAQLAVARRLGGLTGDVYGMGIELAEALVFVGAVVIVG